MILVREVFHCKFGHVNEVVSTFKTMFGDASRNKERGMDNVRILTDLSGRYFTVVIEVEAESVDSHQKMLQATFQTSDFAESFAHITDSIEWGGREYFNIEL